MGESAFGPNHPNFARKNLNDLAVVEAKTG